VTSSAIRKPSIVPRRTMGGCGVIKST